MTISKVFIYGTLKQGYRNHYLLRGGRSKFLGKHTTDPAYTLLDLEAFPAVIMAGKTAIKGELYEINQDILEYLDVLEGHPHLYQRNKIPIPGGEAWIYTMEAESDSCWNARILPLGEWIQDEE